MSISRLRFLCLTLAVATALGALVQGLSLSSALAQAPPATITVFAAASLKTALDDAAVAFQASGGGSVRLSYAASSALARQVEAGAPADLFASADLEWMDYLQQRGLVRSQTRVELLGNRLVVIAPRDAGAAEVPLTPEALGAALGATGRLATGEVTSVPVGRYAKAALEKLGLWAQIQPRLAEAENVRVALALVARGEAPLGIVYETDAKAEPQVRVVARFPADSHPAIVYPFAVTQSAREPAQAARFLAFLASPRGREPFIAQGFTVLASSPSQ